MKISLLLESDKTAEEATAEVTQILGDAGYKVLITFPDLSSAIKRLTNLRGEIKKIK